MAVIQTVGAGRLWDSLESNLQTRGSVSAQQLGLTGLTQTCNPVGRRGRHRRGAGLQGRDTLDWTAAPHPGLQAYQLVVITSESPENTYQLPPYKLRDSVALLYCVGAPP